MFLFQRRNDRIRVLWKVTDDLGRHPEDFSKWDVVADYDSPWQFDGIRDTLDRLELEMHERCAAKDPKDYEITASFTFGQPRVVDVKACDYSREKREIDIIW